MVGSHHAMRIAAMSRPSFDKEKSLDLSKVTKVMPVGANVAADVFDKLKGIFPSLESVPNFYGLTEFGSAYLISLLFLWK